MVAPRLYKTEGIVLKTSVMGEANLLVTLISQDGSKLRAIAWGARKMNSRKMGHLDSLTRVDLALYRSPRMSSVRQVVTLEAFAALKSRLDATARAFYLAELVDGFAVEGSPNPSLYSLFLDTLRAVQEAPEDNEPMLRFQLDLLRVNGFMPELYRCVECRRAVEAGRHRFVVSLGGVICAECASKREGRRPCPCRRSRSFATSTGTAKPMRRAFASHPPSTRRSGPSSTAPSGTGWTRTFARGDSWCRSSVKRSGLAASPEAKSV